MIRILRSGAGAVVTKSIGIQPRAGNQNPTFVELDCGILNAMGLPNPGIDEYQQEIIEVKEKGGVVIGSIFGSTIEDFRILSKSMQNAGVDAIELNLSCPHAKGYGLEIGQDIALVEKITRSVKDQVLIPVFVKLSSNVNDIVEIAKAAERGNADGIVAINTVKAMSINLEIARPILSHKTGGYSGKAIKPIGVRCIYDIYELTSLPLIGVGGVMNGADAICFTGGIGENSSEVRRRACENLEWLGVKIDNKKNNKVKPGQEALISTDDSRVAVYVIPTNEELVLARDTVRVVKGTL